jgi:hemolysin-activating ACP:hemolysin acyltransferase
MGNPMIETKAAAEVSGALGPTSNNESLDLTGLSHDPAQIEQFKHRDLLYGAAFSKIVSLMMNSPAHNHFHVRDLRWLVVPPLLLDQFAIAEAVPVGGVALSPFAAVLWASVSREVDLRLSEDMDRSVTLAPEDWHSGDILWIIDTVGHPDIVPAFLEEVVATRFPGKYPKMRVIDKQGVAKTLFVGLDDLEGKLQS